MRTSLEPTSISREELAAGMAAGRLTVVDALPASYWAQQHLPGALNLVETDVDLLAPTLLPDRAAAIVVYCSNAACANSSAVARRLGALGYTGVRTYRDGIQDWIEAGLPVEPARTAAPAAGRSGAAAEPATARPAVRSAAEEVVHGFLLDVRSGERLLLAGRYLAPRVRASQGMPGRVHGVVTRSPEEYADHVRDLLRAAGPWRFEITGLTGSGDLVDATWRQTGPLSGGGPDARPTVVEHGRARYRVRAGVITEYWIEVEQTPVPQPPPGAPPTIEEEPVTEPDPTGGHPVPPAPRTTGRPGVDVPDSRGRTGLDRAGRDLVRNPRVVVRDVELLAAGWHVLRRTTFDYQHADGRWSREQRETYDRGNGATILLYDQQRRTVLLSRQFRYPVYVNDHPDGMLVEAAAGLLDDDDPESAIRRETAEELGVTVGELTHVFDVYMSPGSVTERLHFYAAPYTAADRTGPGGGIRAEGEDIDVLEVDVDEALAMVRDGRIADGKTIMLLQWAVLDGPFRAVRAADAAPGGTGPAPAP